MYFGYNLICLWKGKSLYTVQNSLHANTICIRYAVSKLIQVFGVRELATRVAHGPASTSPTIIINCMTPGACKSDFDRESTGIGRIMSDMMSAILARTTEAGSRALVAGVAAGEESHGSYMADCRVVEHVI